MKPYSKGLEIVAVLALVSLAAILIYKNYVFSLSSILKTGGIESSQNASLVYKEESKGIGSDHVNYYCIQLEKFAVIQDQKTKWHFGPEQYKSLSEAVKIAGAVGKSSECFINGGVPGTETIQTLFLHTEMNNGSPKAITVLMVEPLSNRLLYVSIDT